MEGLEFLPRLPVAWSPVLLFGALLAIGLLAGEVAHRLLRLPRVTGYVAGGLLLNVAGLLRQELLDEAWIFVQIALGLVLFELGTRLNLAWLRRNLWLLATGIAESVLSFVFIFGALYYFGVGWLYAAVAAAIGASTSPAVVMVVSDELRSEGQVTERVLHLVAVNSVLSFTAITMLLSALHREYATGWLAAALHPLYLLGGSVLLGLVTYAAAIAGARLIGKSAPRQFVLLVSLVVCAVGMSYALNLSVLAAVLTFGIAVRNADTRHDVMPFSTGSLGQLFIIVLFVVTGAMLPLETFWGSAGLACIYVLARFAGKAAGVMLLLPLSGVRPGTAGLVALAMTPMSGVAMAFVESTRAVYPAFGQALGAIVLSAVLILELLGPLALQFSLRKAGEVPQ